MSKLKINVSSRAAWLTMVANAFISRQYPYGLTQTELQFINLALKFNPQGKLNFAVKRKIMDAMGIRRQSLYNMISVLRKKRALEGNQLHKIFTSNSIIINYSDGHKG